MALSAVHILMHVQLSCLHYSRFAFFLSNSIGDSILQGGKILRPEKWNACFDADGKVIGFRKALKFIVLGVSELVSLSCFKNLVFISLYLLL